MKKYVVIGFLIGLGVAVLLSPFLIGMVKSSDPIKTDMSESYPLLAKRIFVGNPNDMIINFIKLRENLNEYAKDIAPKTGIYFEYLPTGVHVGINDRDDFYRASLVKLPLVMRAYKLIEEGKIKKGEQILIRREFLDGTFGDLWKTGAGTEVSLDEIINLILTESDNTAYLALLDRVNQALGEKQSTSEKGINEVYDYLDIPREDSGRTLAITPRNYSSILKALFFSSYLNYPESQEVLSIMTRSKFTDWMPAPIPKDVMVAHKMGIFQPESDSENSVHSDCGIVFYPNRPYVLCVMIKTTDTKIYKEKLFDISKMIYEYISQVKD